MEVEVLVYRGRCAMLIGCSLAEELGVSLDLDTATDGNHSMDIHPSGDDILVTEDADEARNALQDAITFFEQALAMLEDNKDEILAYPNPQMPNPQMQLRELLADSLLTLSSLTADPSACNDLRARAHSIRAQGEDLTSAEHTVDADRMDEDH